MADVIRPNVPNPTNNHQTGAVRYRNAPPTTYNNTHPAPREASTFEFGESCFRGGGAPRPRVPRTTGMWDFWSHLFDSSDFPPRWHCGNWSAGLGWLHIASDLGVWCGVLRDPVRAGVLHRPAKDVPFRGVAPPLRRVHRDVRAHALDGSGHLLVARVPVVGRSEMCHGVVSGATVVALVRITPQLLALRSPTELEKEVVERRRAEEALRVLTYASLEHRVVEARRRWRRAKSGSAGCSTRPPSGCVVAPGGRLVRVNGSRSRRWGTPPRNSWPPTFKPSATPPTAPPTRATRRTCWRATGPRITPEKRYLHKDGRAIHTLLSVSLVRDPAGGPPHFIKQIQDITERKRAEAALVASECRERERAEELAAILDAMPDPCSSPTTRSAGTSPVTARRTSCLRQPRGAEASLSAPAGDQAAPLPGGPGRPRTGHRRTARPAAAGAPRWRTFEFALAFDDGTAREMLAYATPLRDDHGHPRGHQRPGGRHRGQAGGGRPAGVRGAAAAGGRGRRTGRDPDRLPRRNGRRVPAGGRAVRPSGGRPGRPRGRPRPVPPGRPGRTGAPDRPVPGPDRGRVVRLDTGSSAPTRRCAG